MKNFAAISLTLNCWIGLSAPSLEAVSYTAAELGSIGEGPIFESVGYAISNHKGVVGVSGE